MTGYRNTLALVLRKQDSGESDLRITLLSQTMGKVMARAVGVKNIKSSRRGSLELGNLIKCSLYEKNGYIWISETQTIEAFLNNKKTLVQLNLLFYLLEILNNMISETQGDPVLFDIVKKAIEAIRDNKFKHFISSEMELLANLGFGVPNEIKRAYDEEDYKLCQSRLKSYFESIMEKPIKSNKLF